MKSSITTIVLGLFTVALLTGCQSGPPEYRGPATWAPDVNNCAECHDGYPAHAHSHQQYSYHHTQTPRYHPPVQQRTYQTPPSYDYHPHTQQTYYDQRSTAYAYGPTWHQPEMKSDKKCKPCEEYHWAWVDGPAHDHQQQQHYKSGCDSCRGRYTSTYHPHY